MNKVNYTTDEKTIDSKLVMYDLLLEQSLRLFDGCTNIQEALDRLAVVLVPCTPSYDGLMTFADKVLLDILVDDSNIIYHTFVAKKNQRNLLSWIS
jgi:hypothetical protein